MDVTSSHWDTDLGYLAISYENLDPTVDINAAYCAIKYAVTCYSATMVFSNTVGPMTSKRATNTKTTNTKNENPTNTKNENQSKVVLHPASPTLPLTPVL